MKFLHYCRHKTAGWEGVVYEDDEGKCHVTNGIGIWEMNDRRRSSLETVPVIDMEKLRAYAEKYCPYDKVLSLLQAVEV